MLKYKMNIPIIEPTKWGPSAWKFIHYVALSYPENPTEEDVNNYFQFFNNLQFVLPCPKCSENYKRHLKDFPVQNSLTNNKELFQWTVDIHNEVNKESNKREYSYEEAIQIYLNPTNDQYTTYIQIGIILLLLLVLFFAEKKWKIFSRFI